MNLTINDYTDIHVVETFEEAEQFRRVSDDQPVEVGTPVGYDKIKRCMMTNKVISVDLVCLEGVYFDDNHTAY